LPEAWDSPTESRAVGRDPRLRKEIIKGVSRIVTVTVDGRTYHLGTDDDSSQLEAVAGLVNERIASIRAMMPGRSAVDVAILAALNIGDELLKNRAAENENSRDLDAAVREVRARMAELLQQVETFGEPEARYDPSEQNTFEEG